jgi:hypothetical protein
MKYISVEGWFYLHINGDLIYKREDGGVYDDLQSSDFVKACWPAVMSDRKCAWVILVEALALGAKPERIRELAILWKCNDEDAYIFASLVRINLFMDGNRACATRTDFENLQESPIGFGNNYLEAMAALAKELGIEAEKSIHRLMFEELLER